MSRKIPGSAIVPGTITVTQIAGGLNDTTNAAYAQANTARNTANDVYGQANAAYGQANTARSDANTTFATINTTFGTVNTNYQAAYAQANNARSDANTTFATVNTTFGTINTNYQAAYAQANTARDTANNAYNNSNTKLSTSGGSISGDLAITGNLTVQGNATTINVTNLSVNDSMILLSTNAVGDSNDIGFIGHFDRDATATHAGLIRKATENRFYLFDNYEVEPTNNVIDVAGNNFRVGNLRLGIINANSYVTSAGMDVTGQANAAYSQANAAYGQANSARSDANTTFATVNTTFATVNTTFATINTTTATMNTATSNRVLKAGDTMTGQLNISSGGLLVTGNVNMDSGALFVDSVNDRIGVGTTTPGTKFTVTNDVATAYSDINTLTSGQTSRISNPNGTANVAATLLFEATGAGGGNGLGTISGINTGTGSLAFTFGTRDSGSNVTERMRISSNGNVAIGTTSAGARLDVYSSVNLGTGSNGIRVQRPGSYGQYGYFEYLSASDTAVLGSLYTGGGASSYGQIFFRQHSSSATSDSMVIDENTNVGIGTTNPGVKTEIWGVAKSAANTSADNGILNICSTNGVQLQFVSLINSPYGFALQTKDDNNSGPYNYPIILQPSNGNVGIGTTNPGYKLSINAVTSALSITTTSASSGNPSIDLLDGAVDTVIASSSGSNVGLIGTYTNHSFAIYTNNSEKFRVQNNGNVGIGTNNPGAALDVTGTIRSRNGAFQLNDGTTTGGGLYFYKTITGSGSVLDPAIFAEGSSGTGNVHIMTGGSITTRMWVGHNGRVGIGTTSPGNPLTVSGTIQAINGEISLTQNYGITWNNGDNYVKGVGGYHVDITTYDGSSAQQNGIRVVGGTSKSARLITHGGVRYGRALNSSAANKVIRGWHHYTTSGSGSGTIYVHFKTNMWAGGSPSGNIQYTMSLFRATGYSYNAHTIDSLIGFHNWSGSHYNIKITDLGSKAFWSTVYTSADGYTVLVGNLSNYNYDAVSIDWFQTYEYPFVDAWVTAESTSANLTGVY